MRFPFFKDGLLAAPGMRPVIGFYIFHNFYKKFLKRWKNIKTYNSVRFAFFRGALLAGAGMRPVIVFYIFQCFHLREVGAPSRNILHVRPGGLLPAPAIMAAVLRVVSRVSWWSPSN